MVVEEDVVAGVVEDEDVGVVEAVVAFEEGDVAAFGEEDAVVTEEDTAAAGAVVVDETIIILTTKSSNESAVYLHTPGE